MAVLSSAEQWKDERLQNLGPIGRDFLRYVKDHADTAGFFRPVEWWAVQRRTGAQFDAIEGLRMLEGFVFNHPGGAWQVIGWFPEQYKITRMGQPCNGPGLGALKLLKISSSLLGACVFSIAGVHVEGAPASCKQEEEEERAPAAGKGNSAPYKGAGTEPEDLVLSLIAGAGRPHGHTLTVLDDRLRPTLKAYMQAHPTEKIQAAAKLYFEEFQPKIKTIKGVQNFIQHMGTWLDQVKTSKSKCDHAGATRRVESLDEFRNGKKQEVSECSDCGLKETKALPCACDHIGGWSLQKYWDIVEEMKLLKNQQPIEAFEVCTLCGESRAAQGAIR